jgi:membrane-associated protein
MAVAINPPMEMLRQVADIFLHLDQYLAQLIPQYGVWIYGLLFLIIFMETGLVVTPFLPGDSLLFAVGALCATPGGLNIAAVLALLTLAALAGDNLNYWIGYLAGPRVFHTNSRLLNRKHLDRTHEFYAKYGGKTIILARFVPVVRTFAPFVAGIGRMFYGKFLSYSVFAALFWVFSMTFSGYFFGNIPLVKRNFSSVILMIVFISILPGIIGFLRSRKKVLEKTA